MKLKIGIIGTGWLGSQLRQVLLKQGHHVLGTYYSQQKKTEDVFFDINQDQIPEILLEQDLLIFNLTPSSIKNLNSLENYLKPLKTKRHLLISSTGVFSQQGQVDEDTPPKIETQRAQKILDIENLFLKYSPETKILRSGGQYGPNRHPAKSLSRSQRQVNGLEPVNMISGDDLVSLIIKLMENNERSLVHGVNIHHPLKKDYYSEYCLKHQLALPSFNLTEGQYKVVDTKYNEFKVKSSLY
jgi:nucleoside-diphosphate-sugar epimerase